MPDRTTRRSSTVTIVTHTDSIVTHTDSVVTHTDSVLTQTDSVISHRDSGVSSTSLTDINVTVEIDANVTGSENFSEKVNVTLSLPTSSLDVTEKTLITPAARTEVTPDSVMPSSTPGDAGSEPVTLLSEVTTVTPPSESAPATELLQPETTTPLPVLLGLESVATRDSHDASIGTEIFSEVTSVTPPLSESPTELLLDETMTSSLLSDVTPVSTMMPDLESSIDFHSTPMSTASLIISEEANLATPSLLVGPALEPAILISIEPSTVEPTTLFSIETSTIQSTTTTSSIDIEPSTVQSGIEPSTIQSTTTSVIQTSTVQSGIEPSTVEPTLISIEPSIVPHIGIEPSSMEPSFEPSTVQYGIEPSTIEPTLIGVEPSTVSDYDYSSGSHEMLSSDAVEPAFNISSQLRELQDSSLLDQHETAPVEPNHQKEDVQPISQQLISKRYINLKFSEWLRNHLVTVNAKISSVLLRILHICVLGCIANLTRSL